MVNYPENRFVRRWYGMRRFHNYSDLDLEMSSEGPGFELFTCKRYIPQIEDSAVSTFYSGLTSDQSMDLSETPPSLGARVPTPDPRQPVHHGLSSQQRRYWGFNATADQIEEEGSLPATVIINNGTATMQELPHAPGAEQEEPEHDSLQDLIIMGGSLSANDQERIKGLLEGLYVEQSPPPTPRTSSKVEKITPVSLTTSPAAHKPSKVTRRVSPTALSPHAAPFRPKRLNTTPVAVLETRANGPSTTIEELNMMNTQALQGAASDPSHSAALASAAPPSSRVGGKRAKINRDKHK